MPEGTSTARRLRPSPSIIISIFALVIAMSSGAYAAVTIAEKNSVVSKSIKNKNVKSADIKPGAVKAKQLAANSVDTSKIADGTVSSADIGNGQIGASDFSATALASYYTKAQSDAALGSYYTKAQSDAALGNYYTKAQSDAKYAPIPGLMRGVYSVINDNAAGFVSGSISFPYTLSAPPTVTVVPVGGPATAACPGTLANPLATAGNLCVYQRYLQPGATLSVYNANINSGASPFGAVILASGAADGYFEISGSWAVRPLALASNASPSQGAGTPFSGPARDAH